MPKTHRKTMETILRRATVMLGILTLFLASAVTLKMSGTMQAYIVRKPVALPWIVYEPEDVEKGVVAPGNAHVVFHLPMSFTSIHREILLGHKGKRIRYWGYCYPENYDPKRVETRSGFKGLLFLSERERAVRAEKERANAGSFSLSRLPTKEEVERSQARVVSPVRHQFDTFKPGQLCYLMSEENVALGIDVDGDRLNTQLERELGTRNDSPDSDGDGIGDGIEYLYGTKPLLRDTDSDSIIDGIEDRNWNGRINLGETDPRTKDSDRDGLCDGICRVRLANKQELYIGEDRNLNGELDDGETDPRRADTDGNGADDYTDYLKCLLDGKNGCE